MRTRRSGERQGATLTELIVVLAILAVVAAVTSVAFASSATRASQTLGDRVAAARHEAITTGRPVRIVVDVTSDTMSALAHPDGSIIGLPVTVGEQHAGDAGNASR